MAKAVLLVLDSFGIGAMEDCIRERREDVGAATYQHIRKACPELNIPVMVRLGLNRLTDGVGRAEGAYGRARLAHFGADTYMGHQELMGSRPQKPASRLMIEVHLQIAEALEKAGHRVAYPWRDRPVLLVDGAVIVADNIETDRGNVLNVTGDLSRISFDQTVAIARIVRRTVDVSRVIALGSPRTSVQHLLDVVRVRDSGRWGVDSPRARVYGEGYQVKHLGHGVRVERQFPRLAEQKGIGVYRIGKAADVVEGKGPSFPLVPTEAVLFKTEEVFRQRAGNAALLVTVQETDLAGHRQDPDTYAAILNRVDRWLVDFIPKLGADDILIITADHGNDPTIGHSRHTREYTPILVTGPRVRPGCIGTRDTMADVGATLAHFFGLDETEVGTSFLNQVLR